MPGTAVAKTPPMRLALSVILVLAATAASAQTPAAPAKEPPPLWDVQVGASFIGTSGNSDTSSVGADFAANRRGLVWQIESTATAIRTTDDDVTTAERYLGAIRVKRSLNDRMSLSIGEKAERDRLSGIDFRSIFDGSLGWKLVHSPTWTLDGITGVGWNHESRTDGDELDSPVGVLQLLSRIPVGGSGDTTQRYTFYPDFKDSSAFRQEAEVTLQATLISRFAVKFGYLYRYTNDPVPGFKKTDQTETVAIVIRWKASTPAPQ